MRFAQVFLILAICLPNLVYPQSEPRPRTRDTVLTDSRLQRPASRDRLRGGSVRSSSLISLEERLPDLRDTSDVPRPSGSTDYFDGRRRSRVRRLRLPIRRRERYPRLSSRLPLDPYVRPTFRPRYGSTLERISSHREPRVRSRFVDDSGAYRRETFPYRRRFRYRRGPAPRLRPSRDYYSPPRGRETRSRIADRRGTSFRGLSSYRTSRRPMPPDYGDSPDSSTGLRRSRLSPRSELLHRELERFSDASLKHLEHTESLPDRNFNPFIEVETYDRYLPEEFDFIYDYVDPSSDLYIDRNLRDEGRSVESRRPEKEDIFGRISSRSDRFSSPDRHASTIFRTLGPEVSNTVRPRPVTEQGSTEEINSLTRASASLQQADIKTNSPYLFQQDKNCSKKSEIVVHTSSEKANFTSVQDGFISEPSDKRSSEHDVSISQLESVTDKPCDKHLSRQKTKQLQTPVRGISSNDTSRTKDISNLGIQNSPINVKSNLRMLNSDKGDHFPHSSSDGFFSISPERNTGQYSTSPSTPNKKQSVIKPGRNFDKHNVLESNFEIYQDLPQKEIDLGLVNKRKIGSANSFIKTTPGPIKIPLPLGLDLTSREMIVDLTKGFTETKTNFSRRNSILEATEMQVNLIRNSQHSNEKPNRPEIETAPSQLNNSPRDKAMASETLRPEQNLNMSTPHKTGELLPSGNHTWKLKSLPGRVQLRQTGLFREDDSLVPERSEHPRNATSARDVLTARRRPISRKLFRNDPLLLQRRPTPLRELQERVSTDTYESSRSPSYDRFFVSEFPRRRSSPSRRRLTGDTPYLPEESDLRKDSGMRLSPSRRPPRRLSSDDELLRDRILRPQRPNSEEPSMATTRRRTYASAPSFEQSSEIRSRRLQRQRRLYTGVNSKDLPRERPISKMVSPDLNETDYVEYPERNIGTDRTRRRVHPSRRSYTDESPSIQRYEEPSRASSTSDIRSYRRSSNTDDTFYERSHDTSRRSLIRPRLRYADEPSHIQSLETDVSLDHEIYSEADASRRPMAPLRRPDDDESYVSSSSESPRTLRRPRTSPPRRPYTVSTVSREQTRRREHPRRRRLQSTRRTSPPRRLSPSRRFNMSEPIIRQVREESTVRELPRRRRLRIRRPDESRISQSDPRASDRRYRGEPVQTRQRRPSKERTYRRETISLRPIRRPLLPRTLNRERHLSSEISPPRERIPATTPGSRSSLMPLQRRADRESSLSSTHTETLPDGDLTYRPDRLRSTERSDRYRRPINRPPPPRRRGLRGLRPTFVSEGTYNEGSTIDYETAVSRSDTTYDVARPEAETAYDAQTVAGIRLGVVRARGGENGFPVHGGYCHGERCADGGLAAGVANGTGRGTLDAFLERRRTGANEDILAYKRELGSVTLV